jgi:eukaryotic-like serine/threonine-protein kinase
MGPEETVFVKTGFQVPDDWSSDGKWLVYTEDSRGTGMDLWALSMGASKSQPLFNSPFAEWGGRLSPDSQWVAYISDETGQNEVFVAPFQRPGAKLLVSTGGGLSPRWRADGRELYYITSDLKAVMMVPIDLRPTFKAGAPIRLFPVTRQTGFRSRARYLGYDVSPDGQRFLMSVAPTDQERVASQIIVVQNWTSGLTK